MKMFDPTEGASVTAGGMAPLPRLRGGRLGLVENTKFNSETLLRKLGERLARKYGTTLSVVHRKRSPSHEIEDGVVPALRRQADLVISGIGD
jgi:hypothetical protein